MSIRMWMRKAASTISWALAFSVVSFPANIVPILACHFGGLATLNAFHEKRFELVLRPMLHPGLPFHIAKLGKHCGLPYIFTSLSFRSLGLSFFGIFPFGTSGRTSLGSVPSFRTEM